MAREIKFRAWDIVRNRYYQDVQNVYDENIGDNFQNVLDDEDLVVEQYTGLKDKNGVEIYEGDVICSCGDLSVITFQKGAFLAVSQIEEVPLFECHVEEWEVVGNIHENPEMLEE